MIWRPTNPVSLRSLMQGKKLVMVLYFAPWCPNWRNEAPVAASLLPEVQSAGIRNYRSRRIRFAR